MRHVVVWVGKGLLLGTFAVGNTKLLSGNERSFFQKNIAVQLQQQGAIALAWWRETDNSILVYTFKAALPCW